MNFQSKSDIVADAIRRLIQSNELEPGVVLRQRDLAERFGVSPTPVREALQRLEAEGFVSSELHRGATVVRPERARIEENFLIRESLEGLATRLAAQKIDEQTLQELTELNAELATLGPDDPRRFELNREFHFGIYRAADSPILNALLNLLWRSLDGGPGHGRPTSEAVSQHTDILAALRAGDGELAAAHVRHHIETGMSYETAYGDVAEPSAS